MIDNTNDSTSKRSAAPSSGREESATRHQEASLPREVAAPDGPPSRARGGRNDEGLRNQPKPDPRRVDELLAAIETDVQDFHRTLEAFQGLGCELKDLEKGLVDFYSMRGNDVVYLCWMDGEDGIQWWHPLDTGVKGRLPL